MLRVFALLVLLGSLALPAWGQAEPEVRLAGQEAILEAVQTSDARLTVLNVWATWCAPCIKEFPDFVRLSETHADEGVEVLFVSADFEEDLPYVKAFLAEQNWSQPSFLRTGKDHAFVNALSPEWSGALPATFLYDADGQLVAFWEGEIESYEALVADVERHLR